MSAVEFSQPGVLLGNDLTTPHLHEIPPNQTQLVTVDLTTVHDVFPPFDPATLIVSTRSRYAQLGGEFPHVTHRQLGNILAQPDTPALTQLQFHNHSHAPLALEPGDVCKVMLRQGPPLTGDSLMTHIAERDITMGGKKGVDWWIAEADDGTPVGVGMYVQQPESWIRPRSTAIRPQGETTTDFRREMKKYLTPLNPGDRARVRISETHKPLFTSPNIIAFFDQQTEVAHDSGVRIANPQQINAPALYGGYPRRPWPLRTELLSTEIEWRNRGKPLPPKAVVATFYHVLNPKN